MNDGGYRKRLAEDLPRWRDAGWVSAEGAAAILASVEGKRSTFGLAAIVGVLGALLLGAGFVAFVAANWTAMPRIVRFEILVAALAAAYVGAAVLASRELRAFSEAALLVAGLVFAAAIALVGQTYHLSGAFSDAVLLWEVGIVAAALLTRSATLTVLGLVGAGYWTWLNVADLEIVPAWRSLLFVLVGTAIALWVESHHARRIAALTLAFWIAVNILGLGKRLDWSPNEAVAVAATAALAFWSAGSALVTLSRRPPLAALGHAMLWPGIAGALLAVGLSQPMDFWRDPSGSLLPIGLCGAAMVATTVLVSLALQRHALTIADAAGAVAIGVAAVVFAYWTPEGELFARLAGGILVLAAALWAVNLGQTGTQRVGKTTGLAAFGIEVIYLYVVTLGTLIDTALAFLLGGILFIALAFGLYRIDRRLAGKGTEAPR